MVHESLVLPEEVRVAIELRQPDYVRIRPDALVADEQVTVRFQMRADRVGRPVVAGRLVTLPRPDLAEVFPGVDDRPVTRGDPCQIGLPRRCITIRTTVASKHEYGLVAAATTQAAVDRSVRWTLLIE